MKKRLARKIKKYRNRYSSGKYRRALIKLGWKPFTWKVEARVHA